MKILILLSRVPYPLEKGDKLRAFNQIKLLSKKHQIVLFALNDAKLDDNAMNELKKYCISISIIPSSKIDSFFHLLRTLFSKKPFQVGYFYSDKAQQKVDELIHKHKPDHVYCQLIRTAQFVKNYSNLPKTLDYMDVFSKGIERRKKTSSIFLRPLFALEYKRLLNYERKVFEWFKHKTIISEQDKNFIPHPERQQIKVIPNGVDTEFFRPIVLEKEYEIIFSGNMQYPPNIESAEYLIKKIMPIVWKQLPQTRVLISGANPSKKVLALQSANTVVSGWVEDIRENYAQSKILVAPMQISIGLQNKLLEAMAMQLPCITSSLANNAIGTVHNEHVLVADSPEQFANHILELLKNENKAKQIAMSGYKFVLKNFNWQSTTAQLDKLFYANSK